MCCDSTPGPVVTNCSTSRMTEDLARKYGVPFFRSAVGEANVVDVMLECGAVLGGEGNGGVIDPRVGLVRDSFVGMALVLDAMAARDLPVSALADELPRYAIHKTKVDLAREQGCRRRSMHWSGNIRQARPIGSTGCGSIGKRRRQRVVAAGAGEQHGADRPHHCRGADGRRGADGCAMRRRP